MTLIPFNAFSHGPGQIYATHVAGSRKEEGVVLVAFRTGIRNDSFGAF